MESFNPVPQSTVDVELILRYVFASFLNSERGQAMHIVANNPVGRERFKKTLSEITNVAVPV